MASPNAEPTSPPSNTETTDETPMPKKQRKPRAGARSGASKDCFQCLKSGSTCDRQRPYCGRCVEKYGKCPGYTTQLTWDVGVASRGKMRGQSLPIPMAKTVAPVLDSPPSAATPTTSTQSPPAATSPTSIYEFQQQRPRLVTGSSDSGPSGWEDAGQARASPHEESTPDTSYHLLQREHIHNSSHRIKKRRASPPYSAHSSAQASDMPQMSQANLVQQHTLVSHISMPADQHGHWSNMDGYSPGMLSDGSHGVSQHHQHMNVGPAFSSPADQSLGDTGYGPFTDGVLHIPQPHMHIYGAGAGGSPGVEYMCDNNSWGYTPDSISNSAHSPVGYDVGLNSTMGVGIGMGVSHGIGHGLAASVSPSASMAMSMSSASSVDMSAGVPAGMGMDMSILMGVGMEQHHHHQQVAVSYANAAMDGAYYTPLPSSQPTQYADIGAYDNSGIAKW